LTKYFDIFISQVIFIFNQKHLIFLIFIAGKNQVRRPMTNDQKPMTKALSILLLLAFLAACGPPTADRQPLKFMAFENNPILGPGEPGEWDEIAAIVPFALYDNHIFYLFYCGFGKNGQVSIGYASSVDGFHFEKYAGNPVFTPGSKGFDAFVVGSPVIYKDDSAWVMYYNAAETAIYGPAPYVGRATAKEFTGPWVRRDTPVLKRGHKSEWDGGFIFPNSVLKLEDGTYRIYYTGGKDFPMGDSYIGMAMSTDGINWVKYNDPSTTDHPFADSDPVLMATKSGNFYNDYPWSACIIKTAKGFEMYYCGSDMKVKTEKIELRYARSRDGIHWERYPRNPIYKLTDDPVTTQRPDLGVFEFPSMVFTDSLVFIYYDYDVSIGKIGMATARVPSTDPLVP
jgi:predicted GH43/DUF377 family glycosyl hydrolase